MKPRSGKSVTFSETSTLFLVANLAATPARPDIWFTKSELDSFEANARAQTRAVRRRIRRLMDGARAPRGCGAGDVLGHEKFLTPEITLEYATRRRRHARAVLDEASRSRRSAADAAARLASVAAGESRWARERARAAALFLERDQREERRRCLERQSRARESLEIKNAADHSSVESLESVEWGHRSSPKEVARTRSTVEVSPSLEGGESQTSIWV